MTTIDGSIAQRMQIGTVSMPEKFSLTSPQMLN